MKRITVSLLLFSGFIHSIFPQISNDNDFTDLYYSKGVYLPLEYITSLEETKNNFIAMSLNKDRKYHTILVVTTDSIICSNYEDTWYIIPVWEITECKFEYNNGWVFIDNNGYKYKKISNNIENWYNIVHENYIANIVFKELIEQGDILIEDGGIITIPSLNNIKLGVTTDAFLYVENANLYLVDEYGGFYILEIKNNEYIIFYSHYIKKEKGPIMWSKKL